MELAEQINEKRPPYLKSDTLESSCTADSRIERKHSIRTFLIIALAGILFLLGGSFVFVYRNFINVREEMKAHQEAKHKVPSNENTLSSGIGMKLTILAFVLISVGAALFSVGILGTTTCCVRNRLSKDSERSPILDKSSGTKLKEGDQLPANKGYSKRRKNKKRAPSWMKNTTRSLSREGFRFAAHRHPSVNHISLDGSRFFFRRLSEHSTTSGSDENLPRKSRSSVHGTAGDFVRRIFGCHDKSGTEEEAVITKDTRGDSSVHESEFTFLPARNFEDFSEAPNTDVYKPTDANSGLYNLEQE